MTYTPIVLVGAARSGTKLLRDMIARHPDMDKVPYDVNYIWRYGNETYPNDELPVNLLTSDAQRRIINGISAYQEQAPFLIEKTVSNCLRVEYVHAVFHHAKFIFLSRDAYDVVESSYRQWLAKPDWKYILAKLRTFPFSQAFTYALCYGAGTLRKMVPKNGSVPSVWGPRYEGIDHDLCEKDLLEVCAIQWARSVAKSLAASTEISPEKQIWVQYENFIADPTGTLESLANFIGLHSLPYQKIDTNEISRENIGKGRRSLTTKQIDLITPHIASVVAPF